MTRLGDNNYHCKTMTGILALRKAVCQSENLSMAFSRFARFRGLWASGMPMNAVTASPILPILRLAEELRDGDYRPHSPHIVPITKADGGRRDLRVYMIRDRVAQRALLQVLQTRTDQAMSPFSYGYRPRRRVDDAVARVCAFLDGGLTWVVDADIERCFDSIPRSPLLDAVASRVGDAAAAQLVAECLGWSDAQQRMQVGIPQGSVLAPWLCNIYMWSLDDHMSKCRTVIVRFADDFLLMAATRRLAEAAKDECSRILDTLQLRLHPVKTTIVEPGQQFKFLGRWMNTLRLSSISSPSLI